MSANDLAEAVGGSRAAELGVAQRSLPFEVPAAFEQVAAAVGDVTMAILDRRRRTATVHRRGWLVRRALLAADLAGLLLAFAVVEALFDLGSGRLPLDLEIVVFLLTLPLWIVVAKLYGLYSRDEERTSHCTADDVPGVFHLVTVGTWGLLAVGWLSPAIDPDLTKLTVFWALAIVAIVVARAASRELCRRSMTYLQNAVIVGSGEVARTIAQKVQRHPSYGINLVGFVDSPGGGTGQDLHGLPPLGPPEALPTLVRLFDIERVLIAFPAEPDERTLELIRSMGDLDVQVDIVPHLFEVLGPGVELRTVEAVPVIGLPPPHLPRSSRFLKRAMDLAGSGLALVALAPFFAAIALRIKLDSPGPVFFRQIRMGANGRTFRIFKFRTMVNGAHEERAALEHLNAHANGGDPRLFKVPGDPRVTSAGRLLRRRFLDELPQLINVLKGDMSLVGPRPLVLDEARHVREWARKRLDLKPGMTGLWQALGGSSSEIGFEEMVRLDYLYVTSWSLWNDVRLLLQTLPLVLHGRGGAY